MLSVMVADDNRHIRDIIVQILRALGVRTMHMAEDGVSAFQILCSQPIDIVIIDNRMQPISGTDFTRLVRRSEESPNPYVPILMVTGYADKRTIIEARNAGVHDIIVKPLSAALVSTRLSEVILNPRNFVRTKTYFGPDRRDGHGLDSGDRRRTLDATPILDALAALPPMPVAGNV
jgi:two-component system, chemotaxis family, chemotaxis protein CheY